MAWPSFCRILIRRNKLSCRSFCYQANCFAENTDQNKAPHIPVMLNEVIEHLNLKEGDVFLDMTFGAGGHSSALLKKIPKLKVLALDRDPVAQEYANNLSEKYPGQVIPLLGRFSDLPYLLESINVSQNSLNGILFDLGCSSMQFDVADRGFSVNKDGPLDMRMDGNRIPDQLTAADVVKHATEEDLKRILKVYGGEKKATKIAAAIVAARYTFKPLNTTSNLYEFIEIVCGNELRTDKLNRKTHVATKVFQALRIFVNNEMNELNYGLLLAQKYLVIGGRAVALTFHSLEDYLVKTHFHNLASYNDDLSPLKFYDSSKYFHEDEIDEFSKKVWEQVNKKIILPSDEEVKSNPRSRSAKLRAAIKIDD